MRSTLYAQTDHLSKADSMNSSALLVSDDLILRGEARSMLDELHIECVCSGTLGFKKALIAAKFDAVVFDYSTARETVEAIQHVRIGKINRYSIILALVADSRAESAARAAGANFAIRRSSGVRDDLERSLQSAYTLIMRERRRYERHPVNVRIDFLYNGGTITGRMIDISEGGACVECELDLTGQPIQLRFSLPGLEKPLTIEGARTWTRDAKLGIRFTSFADASQTALTNWLQQRIKQSAK